MISILIPTYNYNVYPLVKEIHKQFSKQGIDFEIRVYDDASTKEFDSLVFLRELDKVIYKKMKKNMGRTKLRHLLAQEAKFSKLLFIDADMFPKDRFFAAKTLKILNRVKAEVYFGGISLPPSPPSPTKILRWKYGKEREALPLSERKKNPYKSIISSYLLIDKESFLKASDKLKDIKRYGLDIYFSYLLKQQQAKVYHFDNPLMHLGLEDTPIFLEKTKKAVETLDFLIKKKYIPANYSKLGKIAHKIESFKLCSVSAFLFKVFSNLCVKNLFSKKPSLFIFDLYKLCYFCKISRR